MVNSINSVVDRDLTLKSVERILINLSIFQYLLIGTFVLVCIPAANDLNYTKLVFTAFSLSLAYGFALKVNMYRFNAHRLIMLGFVWFFWCPFFDLLFGFQLIEYIPALPSRIDNISAGDDLTLAYILSCGFGATVSYLILLSILGYKLPPYNAKKDFLSISPLSQKVILYGAALFFGGFYLLLNIYLMTDEKIYLHWTEQKRFGGGLVNYILSNLEFFFHSVVLVIFLFSFNHRGTYIRLLVFFCLILCISSLFLENSRIHLLAFLMGLIVTLERVGIQISWRLLLGFAVFGFLFVVFVDLRRTFLGAGFFEILENVSIFTDAGLGLVNVARKELEFFPGISFWVDAVEKGIFEDFGYSPLNYIWKIALFWLPPFFGDAGPITTRLGYALTSDPLFSCNITAVGEVMLIFGLLGIPLISLALCIIVLVVDRLLVNYNRGAAFVVLAPILLQLIRGPFYYQLSQIILIGMLWFFIVLIMRGLKV